MFYRALWGLLMGLELPKFKIGYPFWIQDFPCNGSANSSKAPLLYLNLQKMYQALCTKQLSMTKLTFSKHFNITFFPLKLI